MDNLCLEICFKIKRINFVKFGLCLWAMMMKFYEIVFNIIIYIRYTVHGTQ